MPDNPTHGICGGNNPNCDERNPACDLYGQPTEDERQEQITELAITEFNREEWLMDKNAKPLWCLLEILDEAVYRMENKAEELNIECSNNDILTKVAELRKLIEG